MFLIYIAQETLSNCEYKIAGNIKGMNGSLPLRLKKRIFSDTREESHINEVNASTNKFFKSCEDIIVPFNNRVNKLPPKFCAAELIHVDSMQS